MLYMKTARLISALCAVSFAVLSLPFGGLSASSDSGTANIGVHELIIDSKTINKNKNSEWQGLGMVSANGSSRLLLDYKYEDPDEYQRILELLFAPDGPLKMQHFKIEMGSDINPSAGVEPSSKRAADEPPNVRRGAGFQVAADVMEINPDVTFELISWGVPGYIRNADESEQNELRYRWFKQTIDTAYEEYGITIGAVDPNINERGVDKEWIKYFSKQLKSEKDTAYDYSSIKIVASDEDAEYKTAALMLDDKEFMDAVDVIGIHYTSTADKNTLRCKNEFGKELWYSEGIAPANVSRLSVNADGSGLGGVNSTLDTAGRIVNMYPNGGFTLYEFQPAVAAYYNGSAYFPKQLITANEPWSGFTEIGSGFFMCEHFTLFADKGWQFVDSGCYGDGREEAHVLYDTTDNYLTLTDPKTGDYSTILVNNTDSARDYSFTVKGLEKASSEVQVWETRGPDEGETYDAHYLKNVMDIIPENDGNGGYTYQLTVKPYSMVTVSTLEVTAPQLETDRENSRLQLPYTDDFEYEYYDDLINSRGGAPRYMTDIGGSFEVCDDKEKGFVLKQMITEEMRGSEWSITPEPVTTFGDDTWANYQVNANVRLGDSTEEDSLGKSYAGIGLRYINSCAKDSRSGYHIEITAAGEWRLFRQDIIMSSGNLPDFDPNAWHSLSITAAGDSLSAAVDGTQVVAEKLENGVIFSGRAAIYSSYTNSCFDDIEILPVEQLTGYVTRLDDLENSVFYKGNWAHNTMDSFTFHNRTSSRSEYDASKPIPPSFEFAFEGDSVALIGTADNARADVEIDGTVVAESIMLDGDVSRLSLWHRYSLGYSEHTVKVTVTGGTLTLDAVEFGTMARLKNGDPEGGLIESYTQLDGSGKKHSKVKKSSLLMILGSTATFVIASGLISRNIRSHRRYK